MTSDATTLRAERFSAYAPRVALDWIETDPERHLQVVDGSLAFIDLSGFTAMSERLAKLGREGAEVVTEVIEETFSELLAIAYGSGGSLLKFGGDALLLLFTGERHAERTTRALYRMRGWLRQHNPIRTAGGEVRLQMKAGVHSGPMHLFLVGERHRELLVVGPGATTAVALEHDAAAGQIVISDVTASALSRSVVGDRSTHGWFLAACPTAPSEQAPTDTRLQAAGSVLVGTAVRRALVGQTGLEAEHRLVTVGFLHFGGLDRLIAADEERAAAALHELVTQVQLVCDRFGITFLATDVDIDGGKIILTAGAPTAGDDDNERMLRALRVLLDSDPSLPIAAGVHRGSVFAGPVGPHYRRTYTVMGDAVNLAARVMAHAEPGTLLVTREVADTVGDRFRLRPVEPFSAKGKADLVHAWEVTGLRATAGRPHAPVRDLLGRDAELSVLTTMLMSARRGRGHAVDVVGPPGIGKSHLVQELHRRHGDAHWIWLRGDRYEQGIPFGALGSLVASREHPPSAMELADALEPGEGQVTIVTVDDAQWLDEPSATLLAALSEAVADRRVLALLLHREDAASPASEDRSTIRLGKLSDDDALAVLRAASPTPLLRATEKQLLSVGGGNPLFLEQLAAAAYDGDQVPETLEDAVAARIDQLPQAARNVLRRLAVFGSRATTGAVLTVLGMSDAELAAAMSDLAEFVTLDGDTIRFDQPLYQQIAYGALPYRVRQQLHGKAADYFTAKDADPAVLSFHAHSARQWERSWNFSLTAGRTAREHKAFAPAAELLERGVDAARKAGIDDDAALGDAWQLLGDVRRWLGKHQEAFAAYRNARRHLAGDRRGLARLCFVEGDLRNRLGQPVQAMRWKQKGLRLLTADDLSAEERSLRIRLLMASGPIRYGQGRYPEARRIFADALIEAEAVNDKAACAHACLWLEECYAMLDDPAPEPYGRRALDIYAELGDKRMQADARNTLGSAARKSGRWDEAIALRREAAAVFDEIDDTISYAIATYNLGDMLADQGHDDEARAALSEAHNLFRAASHVFEAAAAVALARVVARYGEHDAAESLFSSGVNRLATAGLKGLADEGRLRWAEGRLLAGDTDRAQELLESVTGKEEAGVRVAARRVRALIELVAGRRDDAIGFASEALSAAIAAGDSFETAQAHHLLATLTTGDDAETHRAEADAIFATLGVVNPPNLRQ